MIRIDVGIGDKITPEAEWLEYPSLLGFPCAKLRAHRPETAIAEKLHAMVILGAANSRMKDLFDIHELARCESFDGLLPIGSFPYSSWQPFASIGSGQMKED